MFAEAEGEGVKNKLADEESEKEKVFVVWEYRRPHGCKQYA